MATWKIKRGDSLWLDITPSSSIDAVDSTWPGTWEGSWTIKTALTDDVPVESGSLILFDGLDGRDNIAGKFRVIIDSEPTDATPLAVGSYFLCIEIYNDLTTFRKELPTHKIKVAQDGV